MNRDMQCPQCHNEFSTDEESVCECPKCGTSIQVEEQDDDAFIETTILEI